MAGGKLESGGLYNAFECGHLKRKLYFAGRIFFSVNINIYDLLSESKNTEFTKYSK